MVISKAPETSKASKAQTPGERRQRRRGAFEIRKRRTGTMTNAENNTGKKLVKKGLVFCMAGVMALSMVACTGKGKGADTQNSKTESSQSKEKSTGKSKSGVKSKDNKKNKSKSGTQSDSKAKDKNKAKSGADQKKEDSKKQDDNKNNGEAQENAN